MITNVFCIFAEKKLIEMKNILILILSFCFLNTNAQLLNKIKNEKPSSTNLFAEIAMLEVEYNNLSSGGLTAENISTYILGISSTNSAANKVIVEVVDFC